jgi:hypothetical protein
METHENCYIHRYRRSDCLPMSMVTELRLQPQIIDYSDLLCAATKEVRWVCNVPTAAISLAV